MDVLGDFAAGLAAPWRGLAFIARRRRTWRFAIVPAAIACVLLFVVGGLLVHFAFAWVAAHEIHPQGPHDPIPFLVRTLLKVLAVIASAGIAIYASLTLASPLSSAALDALVHAHDASVGLPPCPRIPWGTSAWRALRAALVGVIVGALIAGLISLVNLVIPPATTVTFPLGTLLSGYVIAWNLLDYPLALRGMPLGKRARWMADRAPLMTGFSLSASLLLFVPGLGLLLLPAGVVGAAMVVSADPKVAARAA